MDLLDWNAPEDMIAMAIGRTAMLSLNCDLLIEAVDSAAMDLLTEIQEILNDDLLDDSECFHKIEALVSAFHKRGIEVSRHDFG